MPKTHLKPMAPEKGSALYRHFGDQRAAFWALHALLLQVMHPDVSAGVAQFSKFQDDAWMRFYNTVMSLATWVYGGQEGATLEAKRLRQVHTKFVGVRPDGERYTALAPEPWAWVFATLLKGSIDAQQYFGKRLDDAKLSEICSEARQLAAVLGIREQDFPATWPEFEEYFERRLDTLERTQSSDDVLHFIRHVSPPPMLTWIPRFIWRPIIGFPAWLALIVVAGTMRPDLREKLGLSWSPGRQRVLSAFRWTVRVLTFLVPQRLMVLPSVLIAKVNVRILREKLRRADDEAAMRAAGQWDENWQYGFGAQLTLANSPKLEMRPLDGLILKKSPALVLRSPLKGP